MPKRKRSSEPARPPPPPPPPKSLIKLLQTDKNVLKYFTLLQANLEADKVKWKTRARNAENECEELKKKLQDLRSAPSKSTPAAATPMQAKATSAASIDVAHNTANKSLTGGAVAKGEVIDDDMLGDIFDNLSSDDDDDESSVDFGFNKASTERNKPSLAVESSDDDESSIDFGSAPRAAPPRSQSKVELASENETSSIEMSINNDLSRPTAVMVTPKDFHHPFHDVYYQRLCEASDNLERLGVSLVNDDGSYRSDEEVVEDLLQALRATSRVQMMSRNKENTAPFMEMIPACDWKDHPAYEAKQCAFAALRIMDIFCCETDAGEWEALTKEHIGDQPKSFQIGFRNRQPLVKNFMQSLSAEISDAWPVADRSTRVISTALHFDPTLCEDLAGDNELDKQTDFGAKSQARLSTMVERCILVQLLAHYYDHRSQSAERVPLLCRYVLAAAPSLAVEDYPKYPPVLSMLIIEALVTHRNELFPSANSGLTDVNDEDLETLQAVGLAVHMAMHVWQQRLRSNDDRITDIARIQVASYERVLKLDLQWFGARVSSLEDLEERVRSLGAYGNTIKASILAIVSKAIYEKLYETTKTGSVSGFDASLAHSVATRNLQIRRLDWYRELVGTRTDVDEFTEQQAFLRGVADATDGSPDEYWKRIAYMVKCCVQLSDGLLAARVAQDVLKSQVSSLSSVFEHEALYSLIRLSQIPFIRFINLKRRLDRRNAFQAQAKVEKLLIVDAVADLEAKEGDTCYFWGSKAFDGRSESLCEDIENFVATHWRPSDLKAFDKDALPDDRLVQMSSSERACALSHIASWEGVRRSLEIPPSSGLPTSLFTYPDRVLRLFRVSGFASGKALLPENESMPPSAVSVILEDDAILVDRFVDRLQAVLRELPRDFHFCSWVIVAQ
ncbi:hypothetical protein MHU86_25635 [Fragilaria crotonensis]|nr:hypothetical protein MHU86_25635 [Fragilaria crotonensis]